MTPSHPTISRSAPRREAAPANRCNRDLYSGADSARAWIRVASSQPYRSAWFAGDALVPALARVVAAVAQVPLMRAALLGVGDGHLEQAVLRELEGRSPRGRTLEPMLVDQNPLLLDEAAGRFAGSPGLRRFQADFEELLPSVIAAARAHSVNDGLLVTLLGGTFANLDSGENRFVNTFSAHAAIGDVLLFDVPVKHPGWSLDLDPRSRIAEFMAADREFQATSLARRLGCSLDVVLSRFEERVVAVHCRDSDVPGCDTILLVDRESGLSVATFRRHDLAELSRWLTDKHRLRLLQVAATDANASSGVVGMAFLAVQTR